MTLPSRRRSAVGRTLAVAAGLALLLSLMGCGQDGTATPSASDAEEITVTGEFDAIRAANGFRVRVERGSPAGAQVSVTGMSPADVRAEVDEGVLVLQSATDAVAPEAALSATVTAPSLRSVRATAGAAVTLADGMTLGGSDVEVDLTAGARFEGEVSGRALAVSLQAGASADLTGSARSADIAGSESGVLTGFGLTLADAKVTLSSGSRAELTVQDSLAAVLSTGATLTYAGDPKIAKRRVESGATLQPAAGPS